MSGEEKRSIINEKTIAWEIFGVPAPIMSTASVYNTTPTVTTSNGLRPNVGTSRSRSMNGYTILKLLGWGSMISLAVSYVFLFFVVANPRLALVPASAWFSLYLISLIMAIIYNTMRLPYTFYLYGLLPVYWLDHFEDFGTFLLFAAMGTFTAIPLGIAYLFFHGCSWAMQFILGFYFIPAIFMISILVPLLLINK